MRCSMDILKHHGILGQKWGVRLDNKAGRIAIATRNDEKYRNVGVASASVEKVLKWFDDNPYILELEWDAFTENTKLWKLAEKFGFERDEYESYGGVEVYKKNETRT